jgi:hypothetical protein
MLCQFCIKKCSESHGIMIDNLPSVLTKENFKKL